MQFTDQMSVGQLSVMLFTWTDLRYDRPHTRVVKFELRLSVEGSDRWFWLGLWFRGLAHLFRLAMG